MKKHLIIITLLSTINFTCHIHAMRMGKTLCRTIKPWQRNPKIPHKRNNKKNSMIPKYYLNHMKPENQPPLVQAVLKNDPALVQSMLDDGLDHRKHDYTGKSALEHAQNTMIEWYKSSVWQDCFQYSEEVVQQFIPQQSSLAQDYKRYKNDLEILILLERAELERCINEPTI